MRFWRDPATGVVTRSVDAPSPSWVEVDPIDHIPTQRRTAAPVRGMDFGTPVIPMSVQAAENRARSRALGNALAAVVVMTISFLAGLSAAAWWFQ